MISASHNPARDNGLKVFGPDGYKLPDDAEEALEKMMDEPRDRADAPPGDAVGRFFYEKESYERYKEFLLSSTRGNFQGLKIVIDAANGAAGKIAPDVFETLSAGVRLINAAPDGKNINVACGSTHPEALSRAVLEEKADLGLAFDGDADRLIAADEKGNIVDGDKIIATLAVHMKERNLLPGHKIVTTVMSNMGLEHYLAERGIAMLRAPVGDRYVLEKMREEKAVLGGEQSGHIILSDYAVTGDGVLSALKLLEIVRDGGISLGELVRDIRDWPQILLNLRVDPEKKKNWDKNPAVLEHIAKQEQKFGKEGRILVRASGTEPLIRIMTEGREKNQVEEMAAETRAFLETILL